MFTLQTLQQINDYFLPKSGRNGVFSYRFHGFHPELESFFINYVDLAKKHGYIQIGKMPNPTPAHLTYYSEILGDNFELNGFFLSEKLKKWLPRLTLSQNTTITTSLLETLQDLEKSGKNLNILKNIFIKFMCWMYYRFEGILGKLDGDVIPKILYEGDISDYELRMFSVFSKAGCDLLLVEKNGENGYKSLDPSNKFSMPFSLLPLSPFPSDFTSLALQTEEILQAPKINLQNAQHPRRTAITPPSPSSGFSGNNTQENSGSLNHGGANNSGKTPQNHSGNFTQNNTGHQTNINVNPPQNNSNFSQTNPNNPQNNSTFSGNNSGFPSNNSGATTSTTSAQNSGNNVGQTGVPLGGSGNHSQINISIGNRGTGGSLVKPCSYQVKCNVFSKDKAFASVVISPVERGGSVSNYHTCYYHIVGAMDRVTYLKEVYTLHQTLLANGRPVLTMDNLPTPTPYEIGLITRKNYENTRVLIGSLASQISYPRHPELGLLMANAFVETLENDKDFQQKSLNQQCTVAVYLLCWLLRYQSGLFSTWNPSQVSCLFLLNGIESANTLLFFQLLRRLPVDILVLCPDLNQRGLVDGSALEERYPHSLTVDTFPDGSVQAQMGTVAYHAERDLDTLLYDGNGLFRNHQYENATTIVLKTMFEEIEILWNQEMAFRPNFSTLNNQVHLPVLFAKVSGVKEGNLNDYWGLIRNLLSPETKVMECSSGDVSGVTHSSDSSNFSQPNSNSNPSRFPYTHSNGNSGSNGNSSHSSHSSNFFHGSNGSNGSGQGHNSGGGTFPYAPNSSQPNSGAFPYAPNPNSQSNSSSSGYSSNSPPSNSSHSANNSYAPSGSLPNSGASNLVGASSAFLQGKQTGTKSTNNLMMEEAPRFYKNNKLQKSIIYGHSGYRYGFLKQETQDYMLERLEFLLAQQNIKGMGSHGVEYRVIGVALQLETDILRMIQGFDFTKKNPKIIYIHTKEVLPSLDDAILLSYLNVLGFDVVTFVPTGYQSIDAHFVNNMMDQHQIGTYMYDVTVPKLTPSSGNKRSWGNKFFKRGGS